MNFEVQLRKPSAVEFNQIRKLAGWPEMDFSLVEIAMTHTLFAVVILDKDGIAAMGRVVGDGAIYLHIADVIVRPDLQRRGLGRLVMKHVMEYISRVGGQHTNIGLMASKGREKFYEEFGFIRRPAERFGAGMIMIKT